MLNGRGRPPTSMGHHVQNSSVQCQAPATRRALPQHCQLLRHTLRGQQVNGDPRQNDFPPTLRQADPQGFLCSTGGTGSGDGFLGMELDPDQLAIHYTRQTQLNDVPSPHSATTSTVLHSGMKARLRQARNMCVPKSAIAMAEAALKGRYLAAGHDPRMIREA